MDANTLPDLVTKLIGEKKLEEAEKLLLEMRERAEAKKDTQLLDDVLEELIGLCWVSQPPMWAKAEQLSLEREAFNPSASNILQTAMILHLGAKDYLRAVPKLEQAAAQGKFEQDDRATYTALARLGEALLQLGQPDKAVAILGDLEEMVEKKKRFTVGDETCFLEALKARGLEIGRVAHLASTLAAVCRDPAFSARLRRASLR